MSDPSAQKLCPKRDESRISLVIIDHKTGRASRPRNPNHRPKRSPVMSTRTAMLRVVSALALLPLLAACDDQTASPVATAHRPVQVQRVTYLPENAAREFAGVVRARYETDLGFRVAGKIVTRIVNVGDRVHAGDVVA